jgi:sulfur-carrier protein
MELLLFGIVREIVGKNKLTILEDAELKTVQELKNWMAKQYPQIASLKSMAVAVDSVYAEDDQELNTDSEIALIPPVSGG